MTGPARRDAEFLRDDVNYDANNSYLIHYDGVDILAILHLLKYCGVFID